jgi:hypothetical protein
MLKKKSVVMLPTEKAIPNRIIKIGSNFLAKADKDKYRIYDSAYAGYYQPQHLYILSREEIKTGDYAYHWILGPGKIIIEHGIECFQTLPNKNGGSVTTPWKRNLEDDLLKVIATTDKSLTIYIKQLDKTTPIWSNLPEPSQGFIDKFISEYNKENKIEHVMVEYERGYEGMNGFIKSDKEISSDKIIHEIKINTKDNTITIKPVKNSWNREEVIENLTEMHINLYGADKYQLEQVNKWIEENL